LRVEQSSKGMVKSSCESEVIELGEEMTANELSLLIDLILEMIKNNHIQELVTILENYKKGERPAK
jgi:hypothetical protein